MLINFTRCGEKGTLLHCWWECKLVQPLWRTVWRFLKKLEIELPSGTSLVVQWLILRPPSAGDPGSILGQGTRSHMLQPRPGTAKEILKKTQKKPCHMTQQSHSWAYTLRKPELKETHIPQCSSQHCL